MLSNYLWWRTTVLISNSLKTKPSVVGRILRMLSNHPHPLILPSTLSVGGTWEQDEILLFWLHSVIWQKEIIQHDIHNLAAQKGTVFSIWQYKKSKRLKEWKEFNVALLALKMQGPRVWLPGGESNTWLTAARSGDPTPIITRNRICQQPEWAWKLILPSASRQEPRLATPWFQPRETLSREPSWVNLDSFDL